MTINGNGEKKAIYPGSFDPFTNGHLDIVQRSLKTFDHITLVVAAAAHKKSWFTVEERVAMIREVFDENPQVSVDSSSGLIMDYARENHAQAVIRGLRSPSDFEYEYMMASMNKNLNPDCETFFMMTSQGLYFVSSSMIRELHRYHGDVSPYVPSPVFERMQKKRTQKKGRTDAV